MKTTHALLLAALCHAPLFAQKWDTLYQSKYAFWVTAHSNLAACQQYKTNIDSIAAELDKAIPLITTNLGISPEEFPQRVQVDSGTDGMGGWAGGGDVGYQISDFYGRPENGDGLRWIRGVIIGEVINASTGAVTDNWPRDWWVDDVWYFPGFMAGEILKQSVDPALADYWLTTEHYPTYPVYNIFVELLQQGGWDLYKKFFATIKGDAMQWGNIGDNPSKMKTDYVVAYLSLATGRNLAGEFKRAKVAATDSNEVDQIMYVERGLRQADAEKKATSSAWSDFRKGNYASARQKLDALGIIVAVRRPPPGAAPAPKPFRIFSAKGEDLSGKSRERDQGFFIRRNAD